MTDTIEIPIIKTGGLKNGYMIRSFSFREPGFISKNKYVSPVLQAPTPSSGLWGHQAQICCIYIHANRTS